MPTCKPSKVKEPIVDKPHDKLVRRILSNVATARDMLEVYLPEAVRDVMDLAYLERQPDTFVDEQHRVFAVDVLFKTRCKHTHKDAYIWFLIEQQRAPDVWLPLRQFCYIGIIWDHIRKASNTRAKSTKLPFIYPLIISNASTPYKHSLTLRDMIEPEEAKSLFDDLFKTPSSIIDLAAIPDEELRTKLQEHVRAQALLLSLKHVFDKELQTYMETVLVDCFKQLDEQGYRDDVADMLYYLYNEGNLCDSNQFWVFLHRQFSNDVEEKVMTLGQQAVQKALQEGMQQGMQQGKDQTSRETAIRMLDKKFDIKLISEITKLSIKDIEGLTSTKHN